MNWQFHNKRQSLTITDKQDGVAKSFDWSKKFYWSHVQIKLEEKSYKMSFKALSVKIQQSKNWQGQIGLNKCDFIEESAILKFFNSYFNSSMKSIKKNVEKMVFLDPHFSIFSPWPLNPLLYTKMSWSIRNRKGQKF